MKENKDDHGPKSDLIVVTFEGKPPGFKDLMKELSVRMTIKV